MNIFRLSFLLTLFTLTAAGEDYCDPALCKNTGGKPHVACNNNGSFGKDCAEDVRLVEMTPEIISVILTEHNKGRNSLAGGEFAGYESASRMATMQWDDELSQLATLNVKKCVLQTDGCRNTRRFERVGQNSCYFGYPGVESLYSDVDIAQNNTQSYFRKHTAGNMAAMKKYPENLEDYKDYSHFALAIAERNNYVGCAAVRYTENRYNIFLYTCNYATGLLSDWPIYKTGVPTSDCKNGMNPDFPNLCAKNEVYSAFIING